MISNILPSSSGFSSIIKTSRIHRAEQAITRPLLTFLKHLSGVFTENPFSVNQDTTNITLVFPIPKTIASIVTLSKIKEESVTFNDVFTTRFSTNQLPSPYLTLTFLTLFHILNLGARRFPTIAELASVSTTPSTSSLARCNLTVKRGLCQGGHTMAADVLLIPFPNPFLN